MTMQAGPLLASLIPLEEGISLPAGALAYAPLVPALLGFLLALLLARPRG